MRLNYNNIVEVLNESGECKVSTSSLNYDMEVLIDYQELQVKPLEYAKTYFKSRFNKDVELTETDDGYVLIKI